MVLMVLEPGKVKIKAAADSGSGEGLPLRSELTIFLLCPHRVEGVRACLGPFYRGANFTHEGSTSMT